MVMTYDTENAKPCDVMRKRTKKNSQIVSLKMWKINLCSYKRKETYKTQLAEITNFKNDVRIRFSYMLKEAKKMWKDAKICVFCFETEAKYEKGCVSLPFRMEAKKEFNRKRRHARTWEGLDKNKRRK
jgi:hypothetical protein